MNDSDEPGLRPIAVAALVFAVMFGVPLVVDLWRFTRRELEYRRFRHDFEGRDAMKLRDDWTSAASNSLRDRLIRERNRK